MREFVLEIITPQGAFFNEEVNSVSLDIISGRIQILANHSPFVSCIAPSAAKLEAKNNRKLFAIMEGFVQFSENHAIILTDAVEWADNIDRERAEKALKRAEERIEKKEENVDIERARLALLRAKARIKVLEIKGSTSI